ncbi:MAG: hypothetical protein ACP5GZ_08655 [Vulcanisaeta sp.]|uniref:GINS subunit domain-containing protein n=1 Tax=Vulcanisaeta moutnovskia (strain 768-28) TaxID=985053 RepID=F0QUL8_VULM7|nr:hypothetical protein [Vulcanisaeta moutnovskia]ADY00679.1 hypothetical protein VMUT_0467 [Vulcanisaeta moutnovskia 768-28]
MISDVLRRLIDFTKLEIGTEEIQRPPFESYAQLVQELNNRLLMSGNVLDKELIESTRTMVRETIAALIRKRIEKIMRYYETNKEIPQDALFMEERRFLMPLLELRITEAPKSEAQGLAIISFKKGFPVLYSVRLVTIGPFSQFDIAAIPRSDAEELLRRSVIDIVR